MPNDDETNYHRRLGDETAEIHKRLDAQDSNSRLLDLEVRELKASMKLVETQVKHSSDLLEQRFKVLEGSSQVALLKLETISTNINNMGSDPANTPAGRALTEAIGQNRETLKLMALEGKGVLTALQLKVGGLQDWQTSFQGSMYVWKWLAAAGGLSLLWNALKAVKAVVP